MRACAAIVAASIFLTSACNSAAPLTAYQIVPAFIAASQSATRTMHMEWHGAVASPVGIDLMQLAAEAVDGPLPGVGRGGHGPPPGAW